MSRGLQQRNAYYNASIAGYPNINISFLEMGRKELKSQRSGNSFDLYCQRHKLVVTDSTSPCIVDRSTAELITTMSVTKNRCR